MSQRMLQPRRILSYYPSLQNYIRHVSSSTRRFSEKYLKQETNERPFDADEAGPSDPSGETIVHNENGKPTRPALATTTKIRSLSLDTLKYDSRFPLPGSTSIPPTPVEKIPCGPMEQPSLAQVEDNARSLLTNQLPKDRHSAVLSEAFRQATVENMVSQCKSNTLEFVAQDCPVTLRRDCKELFPDRDMSGSNVTVVTLSQRTDNDMSGWSELVENEREQLLNMFMSGAQLICEALETEGFWADFIDPTSGRPFRGAYTNATLFETDERYRTLGFEIRDLGCCKVIAHQVWGTSCYVGCLFTSAPIDHPLLLKLMGKTPVVGLP